MTRLRFLFLLLFATTVTACDSSSTQSITIEKAWVRSLMPDATMTAGYLTMINNTDVTLQLTDVSSPQFNSIEIHETTMLDGTMKMRRVAALDVPAGGIATLAPGGQHLMLLGPQQALTDGALVSVMLEFSDGTGIEMTIPMQRTAP